MLREILCKRLIVTAPAAKIDNASASTTEIDCLGFDALEVEVIVGDTDIALTAMNLTESDTAGSGHANISGSLYATDNGLDGSVAALPTATDDNKIYGWRVDLRGRKRYIDTVVTVGDGTTGAFVTIVARLYRRESAPMTAAELGVGNLIAL